LNIIWSPSLAVPLVYACIAPHGGEIVPALAGKKLRLFSPTRKGMRLLASAMKGVRPDTIVLASPHNLRLHKHIGVVTAEYSSGRVAEGGREIRLRAKCDVRLAKKLAEAAEKAGLPVVAANYGVLEGPLSDMAMDWGTMIPLWFLLRATRLKSKIVIVTPSREIPLSQNIEFGRMVAQVANGERKRIAFVASADQAHRHRKSGPYGFDRRASEYDRLVVDAIRRNRLDEVMRIEPDLVDGASPDSLWQMAMLVGVLEVTPMKGELVSYQVPSYYGMLCAGYHPVGK
jgi:aromatic ring-opening dioxygenase LigB subunit